MIFGEMQLLLRNHNTFVGRREASKIARKIGVRKHLECSSLTGEGVDDVLEEAIRIALFPCDKEDGGDAVLSYEVEIFIQCGDGTEDLDLRIRSMEEEKRRLRHFVYLRKTEE